MGLTIQQIVTLLQEIEIFADFSDKTLSVFAKNMKEVSLHKDDLLFKKGDKDNSLYIIVKGSVQIHDNDYVFTTLNTKQFFGEYSLVDSSVRSATVTAAQDTVLLELDQEIFIQATNKNPELWRSVLIALIKRLRDYNILEEKLTIRTIDIQKKKYHIEQEKEFIEQQKKDLEDINQTKDKFFTIIGHDLKNPFRTIIALCEEITVQYDSLSNDKVLKYIQQINRFSKNAFNLLENLLQWARSQTGSLKINFRRANISEIITEVIELFEGITLQKNLTVITEACPSLYAYIDIDMITTVIRNLVSNAIKYSYQNGKIEIRVCEIEDMLEITVKDYGVGVDGKQVDKLFRIDERNEVDPDKDEGSGLGLILSKEFVLKNGGDIRVESAQGKGTAFIFNIPKAL